MMIETGCVEIVEGESKGSHTVLVALEDLELLGSIDVPNNDGSVISTREHPVTNAFDCVNPANMTLVHFVFSGLNVEASDDWVAPRNKDKVVVNMHALYCFFACNEGLCHLVGLEVYTPYHLVPTCCEQEVELSTYLADADWVSKLEDGGAGSGGVLPLTNSAVVRGGHNVVC
jgi:hypothetical protein